jgi:hypothetical protein
MHLEQQEDQAQFKLKNASASIKERRRRGLTWYPVTITQEDIGFGGKVVLELERPAHRQDLHLFQVGAAAALFSSAPGYSGTHSASDRPVVSGVVTRVRRNKLLLATTKEALPDWVLDGSSLNGSTLNGSTLGIDLTFDEVSYREMNQALSAVMAAHGNRLAELREDQGEIEETYEELRRAIPATADTSAFIDGLDVLAVSSGVTITGLTVGDPLAYTVPQSAVVAAPAPRIRGGRAGRLRQYPRVASPV